MVYFLIAQRVRLVKIGFTMASVPDRVWNMCQLSPVEMKVAAVISGGRDVEKRMHRRFKKYRVRGEWFQLTGDLAAFVKKHHGAVPKLTDDEVWQGGDSERERADLIQLMVMLNIPLPRVHRMIEAGYFRTHTLRRFSMYEVKEYLRLGKAEYLRQYATIFKSALDKRRIAAMRNFPAVKVGK